MIVGRFHYLLCDALALPLVPGDPHLIDARNEVRRRGAHFSRSDQESFAEWNRLWLGI